MPIALALVFGAAVGTVAFIAATEVDRRRAARQSALIARWSRIGEVEPGDGEAIDLTDAAVEPVREPVHDG